LLKVLSLLFLVCKEGVGSLRLSWGLKRREGERRRKRGKGDHEVIKGFRRALSARKKRGPTGFEFNAAVRLCGALFFLFLFDLPEQLTEFPPPQTESQ